MTFVVALTATRSAAARAQTPPAAPAPRSQNPSPMVERSRAHERLSPRELLGVRRTFTGPMDRPVELVVPARGRTSPGMDLVIHFHGAAWVAQQSTQAANAAAVSAVVNLGAGSGVYHRAFEAPSAFTALLDSIVQTVAVVRGSQPSLRSLTLSGYSAGHGAIRAILRDPVHFARLNAVLLLDGMHTSYVPEGRVLADSGVLDTTNLVAWAAFARDAIAGRKRFVVTHSEIFPGTFASTTETADWLLQTLGLTRRPVLRWGPRGMQQTSVARRGAFHLVGFAGNSAPDHVDHYHAMPEFLALALPR